jgi:hypothetical protein
MYPANVVKSLLSSVTKSLSSIIARRIPRLRSTAAAARLFIAR